MSDPKKVTQQEYDELRMLMEKKYGYESMSEEEKNTFDEKIDQVAVVHDKYNNFEREDVSRDQSDENNQVR